MTLTELMEERGAASQPLSEAEIRKALSGNICRCTGYQGIVKAAMSVLGAVTS
jgi:carbon-monoxide dehydrogenase small subunit